MKNWSIVPVGAIVGVVAILLMAFSLFMLIVLAYGMAKRPDLLPPDVLYKLFGSAVIFLLSAICFFVVEIHAQLNK
jgi:O-antigen/teichoic acid export membrane protein